MLQRRPHLIPFIVAAVVLLAALRDWPYSYYQLLRFIVCGVSVYISFIAYSWKKLWATWLFGIIAVLFNPVAPIHLSRDLWQLIDVICTSLFVVFGLILKKSQWRN